VILAAVGLDYIGKIVSQYKSTWRVGLQALISLIVIIISVGSMLNPWLPAVKEGRLPFIGQPGYALWEDPSWMVDKAVQTIQQMKPNSVYFVDWNWLYIYYYAAHIENKRMDLRFIEANPRSDVPGLPDSVITFIEENIDTRPIYFSEPLPEVVQAGFDFQRSEIGFTYFYQVVRP
jgi:hypothetical protein